MIDQATVNTILDRAEIYDVVSDFVSLHRRGANYVGLCPFHNDRRPSFYVSPSKNICKCFACGEGGTPLNFLIKHENISYVEALRYLAKKYGIPIVEKELSPEEQEQKNERERLLLTNAFARDAFARELKESAEGRMVGLSYFHERKFTDESIEKFQLGYSPSAPEFLSKKAHDEGVNVENLVTLGLCFPNMSGSGYSDRFRERVIFPIHSISGNVVGFGGRIMRSSDKLAKYVNSPDSPIYSKGRELYGIYFAKHSITKENLCYIVEGYTDVISMHQAGIENVVASSGTALTEDQCRLIKRFTDNVTLIFDGDAPGIKAAQRGTNILLSQEMNVKVVLLPPEHDPDSFAKTHSKEAIRDYLSEHEEDFIRFKVRLAGDTMSEGPAAMVKLANDIAESVSYIDDNLKREVYIRDSSSLLGMGVESFSGTVQQLRRSREHERLRGQAQEERRAERLEESREASEVPEILPSTDPVKNISKYEFSILSYLIRYGNRLLEESDPETGETEDLYLLDLIADEMEDLKDQKVLTDTFSRILGECKEQERKNKEFQIDKYLLGHSDDAIRSLANKSLIDNYPLSRLHEKYREEKEQTEQIFKGVMTDILSMKYFVVEKKIKRHLDAIRSGGSSLSAEELRDHLEAIRLLNQLKGEMSESLGERVLTPRNILT